MPTTCPSGLIPACSNKKFALLEPVLLILLEMPLPSFLTSGLVAGEQGLSRLPGDQSARTRSRHGHWLDATRHAGVSSR